ncbi:hypothetical protein HWB79_gp180 [Streptomyces phage LukeCage]|jgi:hypothetical protein|uniref:KOW domain-containing protein n=1 Tax=Streptomyces phage LukeCage TaxID=2283304 RepID=A0A345MGF1_9CAUD|nr:hypothetical protein HWB79_gp180 [Streptomyces phage LukeCage]AXH69632.1 hypothetical protein SEA_LUKECAGE_113 [Streptomyces phage LukeCage]
MALSKLFPVGTRVKVTRGSYKNKYGKVALVGNDHKIVVLEKEGTPLYGVSDEMVQKA